MQLMFDLLRHVEVYIWLLHLKVICLIRLSKYIMGLIQSAEADWGPFLSVSRFRGMKSDPGSLASFGVAVVSRDLRLQNLWPKHRLLIRLLVKLPTRERAGRGPVPQSRSLIICSYIINIMGCCKRLACFLARWNQCAKRMLIASLKGNLTNTIFNVLYQVLISFSESFLAAKEAIYNINAIHFTFWNLHGINHQLGAFVFRIGMIQQLTNKRESITQIVLDIERQLAGTALQDEEVKEQLYPCHPPPMPHSCRISFGQERIMMPSIVSGLRVL